jgi:putative transcriptional regulator
LGDILPDTYPTRKYLCTWAVLWPKIRCIIFTAAPTKLNRGIEIWDGIYWGGDFEQIKELITNYQITESEIKFFTGYSGWTPGQLDDELREDAWIVANKFEADSIFSNNEHNLWKEIVISLGQRYAHIANFPENPTLN